MSIRRLTTCVVACLLPLSLASADEAAVMRRIQERFPQALVDKVFRTPYPGLYEVVMDQKLLYTDEQVSFLLVGNLIDTASSRNLTQERLRRLNAIEWSTLPLDLAIRKVKGTGARKLAVFSDPLCPHCARQEREIAKLANVTVYTFLLPVERAHPGATALARAVWCSRDRGQAWDRLMLEGRKPPARTCDDPLARIDAAAASLKVAVTPTLVFGDGTVVSGGLLAEQIERLFAQPPAR